MKTVINTVVVIVGMSVSFVAGTFLGVCICENVNFKEEAEKRRPINYSSPFTFHKTTDYYKGYNKGYSDGYKFSEEMKGETEDDSDRETEE